MELKLLTHVDFRDKILKVVGSLAKLTAQIAEPGRAKDTAALAVELGRVRKWIKFLRILRTIRNFPAAVTSEKTALSVKMEAVADVVQMVSEDLHTLNRSGVWSGLLGLEKIPGLAEFEDQAWFLWSSIAAFNAGVELRAALAAASGEKAGEAEKARALAATLALLKFSCEVGDSLIALTPAQAKKGRERQFVFLSAALGSVSALCSIHKFVTSS